MSLWVTVVGFVVDFTVFSPSLFVLGVHLGLFGLLWLIFGVFFVFVALAFTWGYLGLQ